MLVDPPALRAGFLLPAGDGALIEVEGDDNSLHRTAVGKQRHDCEHQPPRLVHPVEGGVFGLGEGPPTAFAAITALFVAMDHEVALSRTAVGAAAPVVTELLVRVHADTHPLFGGQRPNKDAAGPAYSSTQPSSTLPWGSPASLKLCRAGLASLLNQLSFRKPTTHSGRPASLARLINRSLAKLAFFLAYSGSGEVIHRLARSQRTPNLARVARTVSPVMGSLVKPKPSSKLTSAARSSVHTLVPLPNFLGLWCKSSPKASACSESKAL